MSMPEKLVAVGEYEFHLTVTGFQPTPEGKHLAAVCLEAATIGLHRQPPTRLRRLFDRMDDETFEVVTTAVDKEVLKILRAKIGQSPDKSLQPVPQVHIQPVQKGEAHDCN